MDWLFKVCDNGVSTNQYFWLEYLEGWSLSLLLGFPPLLGCPPAAGAPPLLGCPEDSVWAWEGGSQEPSADPMWQRLLRRPGGDPRRGRWMSGLESGGEVLLGDTMGASNVFKDIGQLRSPRIHVGSVLGRSLVSFFLQDSATELY